MSKDSKVHEINMYHYKPQERSHISVSIVRTVKIDRDPILGNNRTFRYSRSHVWYDNSIDPKPDKRISFASLMRLRRALGRLDDAGMITGYTWPCEYDHTLNGRMRIKDEVLANK